MYSTLGMADGDRSERSSSPPVQNNANNSSSPSHSTGGQSHSADNEENNSRQPTGNSGETNNDSAAVIDSSMSVKDVGQASKGRVRREENGHVQDLEGGFTGEWNNEAEARAQRRREMVI